MEIGIWGDSITYGECDSEALGWVGRLRKSHPIDEYVGIYNRGICGDTSKDLLDRFAIEAKSIAPETIVFAIGINDSKYPSGVDSNLVSPEDFKENMSLLVEQAKNHTDKIYVVGCTRVDESSKPSGITFLNDQIEQYDAVLKEISEEEHLTFIDVSNALDTATDLYDGLHPNAEGYDKLALAIACSFK